MKKGQEIELKIDKNKYPNIGIGYVEDHKVHIKNTIKGQTVRARVTKNRSGKKQARLLEVIERSPLETASFCEHFGKCGGCQLQTLSAEGQSQMKADMVKALYEESGFEVTFKPIIESPSVFEYRNKMEFSFGDEEKGGPLTLGMHKKGRHHDVVTTDHCHLVDQDYRLILRSILDYFVEVGAPKYNKKTDEGFLKHLVIRKSYRTGEIMIALSATTTWEFNRESYVALLKGLELKGEIVSILYVHNDGVSDMVKGDIEILDGRDYITEKLYDLTFKVTLYSFFQTNTEGAETLYKTALDLIPNIDGKVCFDLFSGTGTIGQIMAERAKKVIGVEIVEDAVIAARANAAFNGLENCTFLCGDVFKVLETVEDKPEVIVVDPPRMGMGEKTVEKIAGYGILEIVYVSCNPKTLLEDLVTFRRMGYEAGELQLVDMFPWTGHVETVVLLSQQKPSDRIAVDLDLNELDATSAEMKATYAEIKDYVLKEHGLKVSNLYISQIKRKCGLEVGENYNLAKSEYARQPQCPEEKEKAIVEALKHFGMVS